ncbi:hypothetical protein V2G26_000509 [Clonostachys chloroleuca]
MRGLDVPNYQVHNQDIRSQWLSAVDVGTADVCRLELLDIKRSRVSRQAQLHDFLYSSGLINCRSIHKLPDLKTPFLTLRKALSSITIQRPSLMQDPKGRDLTGTKITIATFSEGV